MSASTARRRIDHQSIQPAYRFSENRASIVAVGRRRYRWTIVLASLLRCCRNLLADACQVDDKKRACEEEEDGVAAGFRSDISAMTRAIAEAKRRGGPDERWKAPRRERSARAIAYNLS